VIKKIVNDNIGKTMKSVLIENDTNFSPMAIKIKTGRSTFSNILNGKASIPLYKLKIFCKEMNITLSEFFKKAKL